TAMALSQLNLLRPLLVRQAGRPLAVSPRLQPPPSLPSTARRPAAVRLYATKKAKARAKGQSARVSINAALVEDIVDLDQVKTDMAAVLSALQDDFTRSLSLRTSPVGALDHIVVTTGDGKVLNQLGQISMKSPQLIKVNMQQLPRDQRRELSSGAVGGEGVSVALPLPRTVTREHRENLAKVAKQLANRAKEALRRARSGAVAQARRTKEGHSEDTVRLVEGQIQQLSDNMAADVDKLLAAKTRELLG
uniref:Ribosome-recycling factor, mitochondrial n=1 Tax=Tetraodon nigroviridis TaxID=99883 RepID=H3CH83_TETNG